jgi:hypothetical protein
MGAGMVKGRKLPLCRTFERMEDEKKEICISNINARNLPLEK